MDFAREIDCPNIQISAALHPSEADVPPEAMLDPVANTLDLRKPFDKARASRVLAAMDATGVGVTDIAFFDNLLHHDNDLRQEKHDFVAAHVRRRRGSRAQGGLRLHRPKPAAVDGCEPGDLRGGVHPAAQGGQGARPEVPRRAVPDAGLDDRRQRFTTTSPTRPALWIALHRICDKHGVGDQFRIHYDPSHAILMGQDTRSMFQYLKDSGYDFIISGFHVKGQVIDARGVSAWGYGGQTAQRGDWKDGQPSPNPRGPVQRVEEADRAVRARAARHRAARSARPTCRTAPSTGSITSSPPASC